MRNGLPDGQGTATSSNGDEYVGRFLRGEFSGYGVLTQSNGLKYDGMWRHGKKYGKGTEFDANGNIIYSGDWKYDRHIKPGESLYDENDLNDAW
jgi:hypothetical protein